MALITLEKAKEILSLTEYSIKRLRKDRKIFGIGDKYDELSVYNYSILQEYSNKNGIQTLIDFESKKKPNMPKKRGKYKK